MKKIATKATQALYEKHVNTVLKMMEARRKECRWKLYIPASRHGELSQTTRANTALAAYEERYDIDLVNLSIEYIADIAKDATVKEALRKLAKSDKTELKLELLYGGHEFNISRIDDAYKPSPKAKYCWEECWFFDCTCYECFYTNGTCIVVSSDCVVVICQTICVA